MGFCSLEALLCFCLIWCLFLRQMKQNEPQIKDTSHSHHEITEIKMVWEAALVLFFPQVERERSILSVPAAATGLEGHWVCCSPIPAAGIYLGEAVPWVMAPGKTGNGHAVVWGEQGEAVFSSQLWEFYSQRAFQCSSMPLSLFGKWTDVVAQFSCQKSFLWIVSLKSQGFLSAGIAACRAGERRMSLRKSGKAADNQPPPPSHSELLFSVNIFSFHCITFCLWYLQIL